MAVGRGVLALAVTLGACSCGFDGGARDAPGGRKVLRVAYTREIDVLNALTSQNLVDIHSDVPQIGIGC